MVYKYIVNGKIAVTNVKGLFGTRIEVLDEKEMLQMEQSVWWNKAINKIKSII